MTRDQISQAIKDIINEILPEGDCSSVDPNAKLRDQLELDSMDFLDIVMEIRKRYGIEIPEGDYPRLATLSSCVEYLEPKMASK
ncbi:MAG TPA: acyl carrier protein [Victivallales bacterium]|nr:acyl carrier protein [Victivallales bacterium]